MTRIDEMVQKIQAAADAGSAQLKATAGEVIAQIRREVEAEAEILAGGLHERAAVVLVADLRRPPGGGYASFGLRQYAGDFELRPTEGEITRLPTGNYRVITFFLPRP